MKRIFLFTNLFMLPFVGIFATASAGEGPYLATGIKIGEVTQSEAIVWARLTSTPQRVGNDAPMPDIRYRDEKTGELIENRSGRPNMVPEVIFPDGYTMDNIQGAVPGCDGKVRVKYRQSGASDWVVTDWKQASKAADYAVQIKLKGLQPGKRYEVLVEAGRKDASDPSASLAGGFKTAPAAETPADVNFIVTTGTSYPDVDSDAGYKFYLSALKLDPEFFVHTGDIVYYDRMAKTPELARWHWDRMYSYPNNIEFHRQVASYFIKDDHDTWMNDAYPGLKTKYMGTFTWDQGKQIFLDEVPMGERTYRTIRWGKDLQIWLPEGRDFRSDNPIPDGPGKTIWGKEQMEWFKASVQASDATYKVVISPTPIVGPDRGNKNDNHANIGFKYEGDLLRKFISEQKNMVSVCGDRHWQYVSRDAESGTMEFSCGPGSDAHAGGWKQEDFYPEHIYLNVVGGFLEGSVEHEDGVPSLIFRHYDPDGKLLNEHKLKI